jgi:hypothetical protein
MPEEIRAEGITIDQPSDRFRGQTDSVSEIDFSLFRIKNLQNLLF